MLRLSAIDLEMKNIYEIKLVTLSSKIENTIKDYNKTVAIVNEFVKDIQQQQKDYYDAQSANWQKSDKGNNYDSWMFDWLCYSSLKEIECPNMEFDEFKVLSV